MTSWQDKRAMSPGEFERTAATLGVSDRTSRRYVAGEAEVPAAAVKLLRLMLHLRLGPRHRIAPRPQGQLDARA